jgi:hypothetical protein
MWFQVGDRSCGRRLIVRDLLVGWVCVYVIMRNFLIIFEYGLLTLNLSSLLFLAVGEELALNSQAYVGKAGNLVAYLIERGSVLNVVALEGAKMVN